MSKICYMAGGMTGVKQEEYKGWRKNIIRFANEYIDSDITFIDPTAHFDLGDDEMQGMLFDLYWVEHSDYVICDFNHQNSIGTAMELAIAFNNKIPIIAFCDEDKVNTLHPWWKNVATYIGEEPGDAVDYLLRHYIEI